MAMNTRTRSAVVSAFALLMQGIGLAIGIVLTAALAGFALRIFLVAAGVQ